MPSEWDEALYGLGLIPPEEEGQPAQAASVPSFQGARNFLFAPLPDSGPATPLHSLATSIGPSGSTVANTFLATMGAPPAAKGLLGGASKALDELDAVLASLKEPPAAAPASLPATPATSAPAQNLSGMYDQLVSKYGSIGMWPSEVYKDYLASIKKPAGVSPSGAEIPITAAPANAALPSNKGYTLSSAYNPEWGDLTAKDYFVHDPKGNKIGELTHVEREGTPEAYTPTHWKLSMPGVAEKNGTSLEDLMKYIPDWHSGSDAWHGPYGEAAGAKASSHQDYIANLASLWHNGEPLPGQTSGSAWDINTNVLPKLGVEPNAFWQTVYDYTANPAATASKWASAQPTPADMPPAPKMQSDEEFLAGLEKDPGASIFDLAGVQGPSSPYKPLQTPWAGMNLGKLGSFPREIPYLSPEQALEQGYVTPGLHGTRWGAEDWSTPTGSGAGLGGSLDALRLPDDELGVNFGTPDQARHFVIPRKEGDQPRTYPTVLRTGRSLEVPDMGTWEVDAIHDMLYRLHTGKGTGIDRGIYRVADPEAHVGEFPLKEREHIDTIEKMRDYLASKGYDSLNYINGVESPGYRSTLMFKPSETHPQFVGGVRSRFAKFDPSKLARPELAAGLAATAAAPVLFDEQNRPFFLTK